jgi:hypothetical protein
MPTPLTPQYVTALVAATAAARDAYPATEHGRIKAGALLVVAGAVHTRCHENYVRSASRPDRAYLVNGACQCPDAVRGQAPGGRCKHRWAVALHRRALQTEERPADLPDWYGPPSAIVQAAYAAESRWTWSRAQGWAREYSHRGTAAPSHKGRI